MSLIDDELAALESMVSSDGWIYFTERAGTTIDSYEREVLSGTLADHTSYITATTSLQTVRGNLEWPAQRIAFLRDQVNKETTNE